MVSWLALTLGAATLPAAAHAQTDATTSTDAEVGEVVVTAQRREERLQDVPIAISAVSDRELASRGVKNIVDLVGAIPGLYITTSSGVTSSNLVTLRGVAGQSLPIGGGQATSFYLDGVYVPRPDGAVFDLDDVERVEVLRGPQGTLYGRNATAGAINIITRAPGDIPRGALDVSYGNFDWVRLRGSLSGPIAGGLSAGVSGSFAKRDGFYVNTVSGSRVQGRETYTLRGKLRYESADGQFGATVSGDISRIDGPIFARNLYALPSAGPYVGIGDPDRLALDAGHRSLFKVRSKGVALTMTYDVNDALELTSVTSFRELETDTAFDPDGTAVPQLFISAQNHDESFYQEVRGALTLDRFRATVGANYYHSDATFAQFLGTPAAPVVFNNPVDASELEAVAVFGQFEFDLVDRLTLVGGLRYNSENRDFVVDYRGAGGLLTSGKIEDDTLIPSLGVNFKATPDLLLYAKVSKGYQAPGFNYNPGARAPANVFRAETLWAYEAGIKSQFLDRRVTFNAAAFYYDYKDIQIRSQVAVGVNAVQNAASATSKGVETSLTVRVAEGLTLGGQLTYLDSTYDRFCQPVSAGIPQHLDPLCPAVAGLPVRADRSGNRLNQAPKWSGGLNVDYRADVGPGALTVHLDFAWATNAYFSPVNEGLLSTGPWSKYGGRVGYQFPSGPEIYVYGRNLGDTVILDQPARNSATLAPTSLTDPRTYGVGVRYAF